MPNFGAMSLGGSIVKLVGSRLRCSKWQSSHRLAGASNWWNPAGIVNGYFTNLAPDAGAAGQPNHPGGRASLYRETGITDVTIAVTWSGVHDGEQGGPMVCVTPSATEFALGFAYEPAIFGGAWVLWQLGRQPDNINALASVSDPGGHTDGVPVVLSMEVTGTQVVCKADGVVKISAQTIPAALQGSTKHGVWVDVQAYGPPRVGNLPIVQVPAVIS